MRALLTELRRIADALERLAPHEPAHDDATRRAYVAEVRDLYAASKQQRQTVTGR